MIPELCLVALSLYSASTNEPDPVSVCNQVVSAAEEFDVDPILVVAVAVRESRMWREAVGMSGERGPLQVLRRFHCDQPDESDIRCSVRVIKRLIVKYGVVRALCKYNKGPRGESSCRYASSVLRIKTRVASSMRSVVLTTGRGNEKSTEN